MVLLINIVNGQSLEFGKREYTSLSVTVEPYSSFKEKSINMTFEFEYVSNWGYIKPSIQIFPALEGGYIDTSAGLGLNLTSGYFEDWRYYGGIRLGHIFRGNEGYPLFGWEAGIDKKITDNFYIGLRGTLDWREDFLYTGGKPDYQFNGGIRFRHNLN